MSVPRDLFEKKLSEIQINMNSSLIKNQEHYDLIINEVYEAKHRNKKTFSDYRRLKRFDILKVGDTTKLIYPFKENDENVEVKYYVHMYEIYDILRKAHEETGHGGLHKIVHFINTKYVNVTREVILKYLSLCETCVKKRAHPKKGIVVQPIISKEVYARAQVDLIDLQTCKDGSYNFIMNYQDHLSKFTILRALKTKTAAEVAYHLIDIFSLFSAPSILQSDNGRGKYFFEK